MDATQSPGHQRWVFPPHSRLHAADATPRERLAHRVWIGVSIAFLLAWLLPLIGGEAEMARRLWKLLPLDLLNSLTLFAVLTFYGGGAIAWILLAAAAILQLLPAHVELSLDARYLTHTYCRGPFRWSHRHRLHGVKLLTLTADSSSGRSERDSSALPSAALWIQAETNGALLIQRQSYALLLPVMTALARRLQVPAIDTLRPGYLSEDDPLPPPLCTYILSPDSRRIVRPAPRLQTVLRQPTVRALLLGCALLWLLALLFPTIPFLLPEASWLLLCYSGLYVLGLLLLLPGLCSTIMYEVTPTHLVCIRSWGSLRRTQRFPRTAIRSVRLSRDRKPDARHRPVLEILSDGNTVLHTLHSSPPTLRFLATHFRRALEVPPALPPPEQDPAYHLLDEPDPPPGFHLIVERHGDTIHLQRPARGWRGSSCFGLTVAAAMLLAACLVPPLCIPTATPNDRPTILLLATLAGLWSLLLGAASVISATYRYTFILDPVALTLVRKSALFRTTFHLPRSEIQALRSAPGPTFCKLFIVSDRRPPRRCIYDTDPRIPRHLATRLRQLLDLPAADPPP